MTDLTQTPAFELRRMIYAGVTSPNEIIRDFYGRIDARNCELNAIVSLRNLDDVLAEVSGLDAGGALCGLPMAPKDLIETAGLRTTHGSPLFANHVP